MLICVTEKKTQAWDNPAQKNTRCTLKGSILIKKHLNEVIETSDKTLTTQSDKASVSLAKENILTLSMSIVELPSFHLKFDSRNQLKLWQQAILDLNAVKGSPTRSPDSELSEMEEEAWQQVSDPGVSSVNSLSYSTGRSGTTLATEYSTNTGKPTLIPMTIHVPIDIVVVIPISSSIQGVKISLVRDTLKFMVQNLGQSDRMGLVTFGASIGATPLVDMATKTWPGWPGVLSSIQLIGQKSYRADVVEGANIAMDLLMQRKSNNTIATILLISDSSTSDAESVDFVVSRAEAAK